MSAHDADWTKWGDCWDRQATVGIIRALQQKGLQVKAVRDGSKNVIYTRRVSETKP